MAVQIAYAREITVNRLAGQISVHDAFTGHKIGYADIIRGFAHYAGVRGQSHEGITAVVRGGVEGLTAALRDGLRNGRDDRR